MLTEKIINQVFQLMKGTILQGFKEEDKKEIEDNYLAYLRKSYSSQNVTESNKKKMLNAFLKREKIMWGNSDFYSRVTFFKTDEAFSIISRLSNKAFDLALLRLDNPKTIPISKEEAKKNIDTMISNLDNVFEYNTDVARELVSEGILDYKYASSDTGDTSLRLHSHKITK